MGGSWVEPGMVSGIWREVGWRRDAPTRRLKAAGLRLSSELSSFSGALHFWQFIVRWRWLRLWAAS